MDGCVGTDSTFVDAPPAFGASFDFVNPWCAEDGDGAIYVYNVTNTHGNDFDVAYFWTPDPLSINGIGADNQAKHYFAKEFDQSDPVFFKEKW